MYMHIKAIDCVHLDIINNKLHRMSMVWRYSVQSRVKLITN